MSKTKDALIIIAAVLLALAVLLLVVIVVMDRMKGPNPGGDTGTADTTAVTEPLPETSLSPETKPAPESSTSVDVTTAELTTEELTTAEITTAEITTEELTTAGETTAEPSVTQPVVGDWVPVKIEGATDLGVSSKGYLIQQKDGLYYVGGILIANKSYPLPSDYIPEGFPVPMVDQVISKFLPDAQAGYDEMKAAFKAENPTAAGFKIQSGYRSYLTQTRLYNNYAAANGKAAADTFSARPGHSEHQTGLAADINVVGTWTLLESIKNTTEGKWLAANSWRFGFILRYPEGKSDKTGYIYEPWHFRYIGKEAAKAVYESGLCLEEFLGIDSVYPES